MTKKVNFYTVDLHEYTKKDKDKSYTEIKNHLVDIIKTKAIKQNDFCVLDLSDKNELHQLADIFAYDKEYLFMRASNQKPSGSYLQRNYMTNIPGAVLNGVNETEEGIEQYTYLYLNYVTGILAIVKHLGAPTHKVLNQIFDKYMPNYYLTFTIITLF